MNVTIYSIYPMQSDIIYFATLVFSVGRLINFYSSRVTSLIILQKSYTGSDSMVKPKTTIAPQQVYRQIDNY